MPVLAELPNSLFWLGLIAAIVALLYFVTRGLQQDHTTGDYHFTWGVGVVMLFLLGLVPGFVGVGLYLTIEKQYPIQWLVLCLSIAIAVLLITGAAV